ncbi:hypothetical protein ABZ732_07105 [Streptomyces pseudogriseolus]|jgi:hypothetical protein|uniref:hypothetical protein n=1 Tax=Streptomyces pseudogriseolus TaxID=36817 RepID=UPI00346D51A1
MGFFSRRPAITPDERDRQIEEGKRRGAQLNREIYSRIKDGTATKNDKRIWNAGRKRSGHIK